MDQEYYMSEACAYFALALNELYGYPLRILVDDSVEDDEMPLVAHVYAVDQGSAVDIKGRRSEDEVKVDFWDLVEPAVYDVTPEELKRDWMGDDKPLFAASESEVAEAKALILAGEARGVPAKEGAARAAPYYRVSSHFCQIPSILPVSPEAI